MVSQDKIQFAYVNQDKFESRQFGNLNVSAPIQIFRRHNLKDKRIYDGKINAEELKDWAEINLALGKGPDIIRELTLGNLLEFQKDDKMIDEPALILGMRHSRINSEFSELNETEEEFM
jgi:hypothetical protein